MATADQKIIVITGTSSGFGNLATLVRGNKEASTR
jgi:NADP-dependent 3-hydroxy acid dehydrogenase YdfG